MAFRGKRGLIVHNYNPDDSSDDDSSEESSQEQQFTQNYSAPQPPKFGGKGFHGALNFRPKNPNIMSDS